MKSMEQVVSLYLRAKRLGAGNPTQEQMNQKPPTTKSSQEFQRSLKDLQHELEQFDLGPDPSATSQAKMADELSEEKDQVHIQEGQHEHMQGQSKVQVQVQVQTPTQSQPHAARSENTLASILKDPKSSTILKEIREGLNLSSDVEVIRMSLVLAYRELRSLLNRNQ
jgi:hypothetical protein